MANFRIYGNDGEKRGGAYQGIYKDTDRPAFGGSNLIYAPVWWGSSYEAVQAVCDKLMADYPGVKCKPVRIDSGE